MVLMQFCNQFALADGKADTTNADNTIMTIKQGEHVVLHASVTNAVAYQWFKDNIAISGAYTDNFTVTEQGIYTVIAYNKSSCASPISDKMVVVVLDAATQAQVDMAINKIAETKQVPNAAEMVTVQGALEQLPGLQDKKTITSRLFTYINDFTPRTISYSEITLDLTTNTLTLRGQADNYEQTNVLANNLKSAQLSYSQNGNQATSQPFSQVVFSNLGKADQSTIGKPVSFQLGLQIDPLLFDQSLSSVSLKVDAASQQLLIPTDKPFVDNKSGASQ